MQARHIRHVHHVIPGAIKRRMILQCRNIMLIYLNACHKNGG